MPARICNKRSTSITTNKTTALDRFSLDSYRRLMEEIQGLQVDFVSFLAPHDQGLRLRFDVDYDLEMTACLAEINAELNISATVFVQVGSPFYNPATPENQASLARLVQAGQWIGLHYFHQDGPLDLDSLNREFDILQKLVPQAQRVVAWHNPAGDMGELNRQANEAGFVSAFGEDFFGPSKYVSDSNFRNMPHEILAFVQQHRQPVQVLLHALNWYLGGAEISEVLTKMFHHQGTLLAENMSTNRVWQESLGSPLLQQLNLPWSKGAKDD